MQAIRDYLRLGMGGLFLDLQVYREQRDAPDGMKRGFVLVVLIGVIVGLATMIGQIFQSLVVPNPNQLAQTVYQGLTDLPLYDLALANDPGFAEDFQQGFDQTFPLIQQLLGENASLLSGVTGFVVTPFLFTLGWLIFGTFAHLIARLLGGQGALGQTLGCTALATGVNLLAIIQVVPFARPSLLAIPLFSLIANYVALREAHQLAPWLAFWATFAGPLLVGLLFACGWCVFIFTLAGSGSV
jgi:hypothetical protein